jgi:hypothetical protein
MLIGPLFQPPAIISVQATVAPNAGAAGQAGAATSAVPGGGGRAVRSANGGNLASGAVPGGVNHAPNKGPKNDSFSAPIKRD